VNTLVALRGKLDLFVSSLLIDLSQISSRGRRPSLGRTTLNHISYCSFV